VQGFSGAAMLPMEELEYTGSMDKLRGLEGCFRVRAEEYACVQESRVDQACRRVQVRER
jgi:hypothetical protein